MTKFKLALQAAEKAADTISGLWLPEALEYQREREFLDTLERVARLHSVPVAILKKLCFWSLKKC